MAVKKGFTLVELLGVIILLGIVGLIVVPSITKLVKDARQDLYDNQVKTIEESARKWGIQNTELLGRDTSTYIGLTELINDGFIEQDSVKDPRTSEDMNGCVVISYNSTSNKYKYIYDGRPCIEIDDTRSMTAADSQYACYNFDKTTGTIISYDVDNSNCLSDAVIPNRIDGVIVRHIGPAAFINATTQNCYDFDNDVTTSVAYDYVRNDADIYEGCWYDPTPSTVKITSVTLPKYLESIGTSAFAENNIKKLNFTNLDNLTTINDAVFYGNAITSVTFDGVPNLSNIGSYTFSSNYITSLNLSTLTNLEVVDYESFANNSIASLTLGKLPDFRYMGDYAFSNNNITSLSLNLPKLEYIGRGAFRYNNLYSLTLENLPSLDKIEHEAFANNQIGTLILRNLTELDFMCYGVFTDNNISSLTMQNLPQLYSIANATFNYNSLTSVSFANVPHIESIGSEAFENNNISSLDLSMLSNLTSIGYEAFEDNRINSVNLTGLTHLATIDWEAFYGNKLSTVSIPASVTTLGANAFYQDAAYPWSSVTIGANTTNLVTRFNTNWTGIGWPSNLMPS